MKVAEANHIGVLIARLRVNGDNLDSRVACIAVPSINVNVQLCCPLSIHASAGHQLPVGIEGHDGVGVDVCSPPLEAKPCGLVFRESCPVFVLDISIP